MKKMSVEQGKKSSKYHLQLKKTMENDSSEWWRSKKEDENTGYIFRTMPMHDLTNTKTSAKSSEIQVSENNTNNTSLDCRVPVNKCGSTNKQIGKCVITLLCVILILHNIVIICKSIGTTTSYEHNVFAILLSSIFLFILNR